MINKIIRELVLNPSFYLNLLKEHIYITFTSVFIAIIVGLFMDFHQLGQNILFFYASSLMGIAIVTFLFIKEKYTVKQRVSNAKKKSALENLGDIDN